MPISFPYDHNLKHWILIVSVALACQLTLHAESLLLWPDGPPGQNKTNSVRSETAAMGDRLVGGKKFCASAMSLNLASRFIVLLPGRPRARPYSFVLVADMEFSPWIWRGQRFVNG